MRPTLTTFLLFFLLLLFYTVTLQPSLAWGDGIRLQREVISAESFILAEMVDVAFAPDPFPFARLGVAAWDHPLYVMLGHLFVQWAVAADPLWLVNFVSAVGGAATITLFYLWLRRHLEQQMSALLAALALSVSHTFWWHSVTPEVYTLFTFLLLLSIFFFDLYERSGRETYLLASVFILGLNAANHLLALLVLPGWFLYAIIERSKDEQPNSQRPKAIKFLVFQTDSLSDMQLPTTRQLIRMVAAFLVGFSPYLVQLLRLLRTFPLSEVMGPAIGATFLRGSLSLHPEALLKSAILYFVFLFYQFGLIGIVLGVYGWRYGRWHSPRLWHATFALYSIYVLFGLVYQVADQFAFFLAAHLFWAAAVGLGIAKLTTVYRKHRYLLAAVLALQIGITPALYHVMPDALRSIGIDEVDVGIPTVGTDVRDGLNYYLNPNKRGDRSAYLFGSETMRQLPQNATVIAHWYVDTDEYFVLRFFKTIEGKRPDVTVVGWPTVDPFDFDSDMAVQIIAAAVESRPVYIASLSESFYDASRLVELYCIVPEANLYRLYHRPSVNSDTCLEEVMNEEIGGDPVAGDQRDHVSLSKSGSHYP